MFKCGFCKKNSNHGEKLVRVATEHKTVHHPRRHDAHKDNPNPDRRDDPGGTGTQIARELNACEACVALTKPIEATT